MVQYLRILLPYLLSAFKMKFHTFATALVVAAMVLAITDGASANNRADSCPNDSCPEDSCPQVNLILYALFVSFTPCFSTMKGNVEYISSRYSIIWVEAWSETNKCSI